MEYSFKEQLAKGEAEERVLDKFFQSRGWKTMQTTMQDQRRGLDRWFECSMVDGVYGVEYKADFRAHETKNVYLETVSVGKYDANGEFQVKKKGWLYTTEAHFLMYYIPGSLRVLLFVPDDLRGFIMVHGSEYRSVTVKNRGYQGRGLLVPIKDIEKIARRDWCLTTD